MLSWELGKETSSIFSSIAGLYGRHGPKTWLLTGFELVFLACSVWTFLLVGLETARNRKVNPHLVLGPYRVPTWALLLLVIVCTEALIPSTSLTGHMCGVAVGYVCMSCHDRFLFKSTGKRVESVLLTTGNRWPRPYQVAMSAGEGVEVDRVQAEPSEETAKLCQCRPEGVWALRRASIEQ